MQVRHFSQQCRAEEWQKPWTVQSRASGQDMHDAARLKRSWSCGASRVGESVEVDLALFWKERAQRDEVCCCSFVVFEGVLLWSLRSLLSASLLGSASLIFVKI